MVIITQPAISLVRNTLACILIVAAIATLPQPALASPASDRAFSACVTAAAAQFANSGNRVGSATLEARDGSRHHLRITSTAEVTPASAVLCTADGNLTTVELIAPRIASNSAR